MLIDTPCSCIQQCMIKIGPNAHQPGHKSWFVEAVSAASKSLAVCHIIRKANVHANANDLYLLQQVLRAVPVGD